MKFGLFDDVDRSRDRPLATQFDERLEFAAIADELEFYCYHFAEHHAEPAEHGARAGRLPRRRSWTSRDVPMEIPPLQSPHPPLWYGLSNTVGAHWAGEHGCISQLTARLIVPRAIWVAFREALAERGGPAVPKPEFPGGTVIGINRAVVVAETDQKARPCAHLNQN